MTAKTLYMKNIGTNMFNIVFVKSSSGLTEYLPKLNSNQAIIPQSIKSTATIKINFCIKEEFLPRFLNELIISKLNKIQSSFINFFKVEVLKIELLAYLGCFND